MHKCHILSNEHNLPSIPMRAGISGSDQMQPQKILSFFDGRYFRLGSGATKKYFPFLTADILRLRSNTETRYSSHTSYDLHHAQKKKKNCLILIAHFVSRSGQSIIAIASGPVLSCRPFQGLTYYQI